MPYGVTGGPATFQTVMNVILEPLLTYWSTVSHGLNMSSISKQSYKFFKTTNFMSNCPSAHLPKNSFVI
jgi:hypothetical protein